MVVAGAVALVLLGSSFNAARGGGNSAYDDDGGLSGGAIAGAVLGGAAAVYFIAGAIDKDDDEEDGAPSSRATTSRKVEAVRVSPQNVRMERGAAQDFQVQVRYAGEQTWQNVTNSPSVSMQVSDASGRVVAVDGAKNVFTAPLDGKSGPATVKVIASYSGAQATSTVAVQ
jgi:hypothetical protein